jgi:hypothetical protein
MRKSTIRIKGDPQRPFGEFHISARHHTIFFWKGVPWPNNLLLSVPVQLNDWRNLNGPQFLKLKAALITFF